jgi:biopolymer transport protein ExbD
VADHAGTILPKHVRRRRPSFVLTSLIDVIFLLVIFFMVSSQIVPYSLLPLGPIAAEGGQPEPVAPESTAPPVAVRILAGRVTIGGESVPLSDVAARLKLLKSSGITAILLTPGSTATVQDVVTVLEASKDAEIASVTVLGRRSPAP